MSLKKFIFLLLVFSLMMIIVACSGGQEQTDNTDSTDSEDTTNDDSTSKTDSSDETVELRFAFWAGGDRTILYNKILDNFEKKYPHIKVQSEIGDFGPYWDKLATQTAAGNPPDVFQQHLTKVAEYADRGQLRPLDDYIDSGKIDLSDFKPKIIQSGQYNGETVMVSMGNSITGAVYNTEIFDEAGVAYPDWNWTWEDYEKTAIELANAIDRENFYGFEDEGGDDRIFSEYVRQRGGDFYTSDGKLGFTKQDMIDYLAMYDRIRKAGGAPSGEISAEYTVDEKQRHGLPVGVYALSMVASNHLGAYQGYTEDVLDITRVPNHGGDEGGLTYSGAYMSISPYTEHPEEAALLIDYWVNDPEVGKLFLLEQGVPGSTTIVETILPVLDETQQKIANYVQDAFDFAADPTQAPPGSSEVINLFTQANEYVAFGQKSIEQAVDDFFNEAGRILE